MSIRVMDVIWKSSGKFDPTSLLVLLALADWANDEGYCWPSIHSIAQKSRQGERNTRYILRKMEKRGILIKEEHRGRNNTNRYTINLQHSDLKPAKELPKTCKIFAAEPSLTVKEPPDLCEKRNSLFAEVQTQPSRQKKETKVEYVDLEEVDNETRPPRVIAPTTPAAKYIAAQSFGKWKNHWRGFKNKKQEAEWTEVEESYLFNTIKGKTDYLIGQGVPPKKIIPDTMKALKDNVKPDKKNFVAVRSADGGYSLG